MVVVSCFCCGVQTIWLWSDASWMTTFNMTYSECDGCVDCYCSITNEKEVGKKKTTQLRLFFVPKGKAKEVF